MLRRLTQKTTWVVAVSSDRETCPMTATPKRVESSDVGPGDTVPDIEGGQLSPVLPWARAPIVKGTPKSKMIKVITKNLMRGSPAYQNGGLDVTWHHPHC